jgi:peptidoglycan/xylan/chitin deacetylase (PgdA/CDA1 family)
MAQLSVHAGGREILPGKDFTWPESKRIAVFFRVAFEGWSDGAWPGIGPMGNPLKPGFPDLNAAGFAEYGPRCGIWRALDMLDRYQVKATVLVCGVMAERHPEIVKKIDEAGHDIAAHSYAMDVMPVYLNEAEERTNIRRTADLIENVTGKRPTGWISPRGTPSPRTARLLIEEGFEWHGDSLNHDLPYVVQFDNGSLVSFCSNMECNDLPLSLRYGNPASVMADTFVDWLAYVRRFERGAARIDPTIHSHVFGRPTGMSAFQKILEIATSAKDVWIGTRSEVASHLLGKS